VRSVRDWSGDGYFVRANTLSGIVEAGRHAEILGRSLFRVEWDIAGSRLSSQNLFRRATADTVNSVVGFGGGVRRRPGEMDVARSKRETQASR